VDDISFEEYLDILYKDFVDPYFINLCIVSYNKWVKKTRERHRKISSRNPRLRHDTFVPNTEVLTKDGSANKSYSYNYSKFLEAHPEGPELNVCPPSDPNYWWARAKYFRTGSYYYDSD
jgi:hypothetical protein